MRASLALIMLAPGLLLAGGCGAARPRADGARSARELDETRIVAHRTTSGELVLESYDASQLFERAYERTQAGDCAAALTLYDRLIAEFPTSRFLSAALYNGGLCARRLGDRDGAVQRFETLLDRLPRSDDARHARLLACEILVELERWARTLEHAEALLERDDLTSDERLEAMARRAQSLLGLERLDEAERAARDALTYYRTRRGDEVIADEHFAAAANFVLAETIRLRSEALALPDSDVARQREVLDRRAQLLLDAQRAYFDTIRLTDARWAAAAGYRIGSMYETLYRALIEAPVPPPPSPMTPEALAVYRRSYREQLAERVRPLVRHAIRYWEMTLLMVERTGVEPLERAWVERTRADLDRARRLLLGQARAAAPSPASDSEIPQ